MSIYTIGIPRLFYEDFKVADVEDLVKWLKGKSEFSVDTETEFNTRNKKSLANPYESKVLLLQIGDYETQFVIDPNTTDIQFLKPYFEDKNVCKLLVNAFFDLRFFYHWGWDVQNIYDCFLAELSLTLGQDRPKGYRGLGQMCERYLGVHLNKEIRGQIHYRGLDDAVLRYAADDVKYLSQIRDKQALEVNKMQLGGTLQLENRFILTLAKVSYKGFKIDSNKILEISDKNKLLALELKQKLNDYVLILDFDEFIDKQLDIFQDKVSIKINWDSPKQVVKLFKKIGINCQIRDKKTGEMKDSVDGKHLNRQKSKFPILKIYLEYKEVQKEITTYGEKFIKNNLCPVTNRFHSEFFPILETGRISSSNP
jgi:DNA polymerase I